MKQCPTCKRSCYDTEMFCPDCGQSIPSTLACSYCGEIITDVNATQCPRCHGQLTFDRYPASMGTIHCSACGKPRPVTSRYCPACGVASILAPHPYDDAELAELADYESISEEEALALELDEIARNSSSRESSGNKSIAGVITICICALVIAVLVIVFVSTMSNMAMANDEPYYSYSYKVTNDGVIVDNNVDEPFLVESSEYIVLNVDDITKDNFSLKFNDYVEITGIIAERSYSHITIIPSDADINATTWEREYSLNTTRSSELNKYVSNHYIVGDRITLRGRVLSTDPSYRYFTCDCFEVVE